MNHDQVSLGEAWLALKKATRDWIYDPNVSLIDYGWPQREGEVVEDQLAIRIFVKEKIPAGNALESAIRQGITNAPIPPTVSGVYTDVIKANIKVRQGWGNWWSPKEPRAGRVVPMEGGISISNSKQYGYATLGGLVKDRETGEPMILSNWHVLAGDWAALPGRPIYQPGWGDGGSQADTVATLTRDAMASNLDAAVATLTGGRPLINRQFDLYPILGVDRVRNGMQVVKSGRRTAITRGSVTNALLGTARINYRGITRLIRQVITINPRLGQQVSAGGDSGSLWLDEGTRKAVGLHFAGSDYPEYALAVDLQSVLDALNVDLVVEA